MPKSKYLTIDISHASLKGGRMNISADTTVKKVRDNRKASLHKLIERGQFEVLEAVRERRIHVSEVDRAVRDGKYDEIARLAKQKAGPMKEAVTRAIDTIAASREPGTGGVYWVCGNALIAYFTESRPMDEVATSELHGFIHAPKATGKPWTSNTKRGYAPYLRKIWEVAGANPAVWDGIELPKLRKTRVVFLSPSEWHRLIEANLKHPSAALLALGCLAGLRIGEIGNLRTSMDVDMERGILRIQPRAGAFPWKPKTDRGVRDVPMAKALIPVLAYHLEHFAGKNYLIRQPRKDRPINDNVLGRWTRSAMGRAGIQYGRDNGYTTHTLRHTFASWLAQRDVQLLKIALLMGDRPEEVAKTYAHLTPRDLGAAVGVIDAVTETAGVSQ